MPRSGSYLGPSLGCRDPDHIARWVAAMNAGKAKLHCTAIAMTTGAPCHKVPLKFANKCSIHCRGAERIEVDKLRLVWLQRKLRRSFFNIRERAALEAQVSKIKRRALRWWWKIDPTLSGSTIALESHDLARACAWLRDVARVDPDALTPRAFDQCLGGFKWSSQHLDGSCDEHSKTALGSFWAGAVVLTRSTAGGRARGAAAILGRDCGRHGE